MTDGVGGLNGDATVGSPGHIAMSRLRSQLYFMDSGYGDEKRVRRYDIANNRVTTIIDQAVATNGAAPVNQASYWGLDRITTIGAGGTQQYDYLGDTLASTGVTAPAAYTPYGEPNPTPGTAYLYNGYRGEQTEGTLTHLRARDYDAKTGTFTTRDPLDGVVGTPDVANPYSYVHNDPLNGADPAGMRCTDGSCFKPLPDFMCGVTPDCQFVPPPPAPSGPGIKQGYSLKWDIGQGGDAEATELMRRLQTDPNRYFPFRVTPSQCPISCSPPVGIGNVLSLDGGINSYSPGPVRVIGMNKRWFRFVAEKDHIGAGGTITFWTFADGGRYYIQMDATVKEGTLEGLSSRLTDFSGRALWSRMAAAMRKEYLLETKDR